MNKVAITMIMPVRTQPRYGKRIKGLLGEGFDVSALFFERDYFEGRELPCKSECIGSLSHGGYFSRIFVLFKATNKIRKNLHGKGIAYCFGMDMLLLIFLAGRSGTKIIYEVSDIRPVVIQRNLVGTFARLLERFLLTKVDVLVVTAPGYLSGYYKTILNIKNNLRSMVIENKLAMGDLPEKLVAISSINKKKVSIGYFGLLRCPRSWEILKKLVEKFPEKFNVHVYGHAIDPLDIPQQIEAINGITYHGQYIWPVDLQQMYESVDVVWACYPFGESAPGNWQWAMTNRFYEACYFKKPLIVLKNSADAVRVQDCEIGAVIDLENVNDAVEWIAENITIEILKYFSSNIDKLPRNVFMYTDEHTKLAQLIRE